MELQFQRFRKQEGRFGAGRQLCLGLTWGRFWCRRPGCSNVYRGQGHKNDIDYEHILGVGPVKGKFEIPSGVTHDVDTDYFYAVRRVSGSGKQEQGTQAVVKLSLDENGQIRPSRPNGVYGLEAQGETGGRIKVSWWYWCGGQEVEPSYFTVYGDQGSGVIDYEQGIGIVEYRGTGLYSYISSPGIDGRTYRFSVRAVGHNGEEDGSFFVIEARINLSGPDSLAGLMAGSSL